jgi:hypothetical protein
MLFIFLLAAGKHQVLLVVQAQQLALVQMAVVTVVILFTTRWVAVALAVIQVMVVLVALMEAEAVVLAEPEAEALDTVMALMVFFRFIAVMVAVLEF